MKITYSLLLTFLLANPLQAADNGQQGSSWKIWTGGALAALGLGYGAYKYTTRKPAGQKPEMASQVQQSEKITLDTPAPNTALLRVSKEVARGGAIASVLGMGFLGFHPTHSEKLMAAAGIACSGFSIGYSLLQYNYNKKLVDFRSQKKETFLPLYVNEMQAKHDNCSSSISIVRAEGLNQTKEEKAIAKIVKKYEKEIASIAKDAKNCGIVIDTACFE